MRLSRVLTFLALAVSAGAQTAPPAESALTNQDVVTLAKAGFNEDFIVETISLSRTRFDTSANGVAALAREGLTDRIIRSMMAACAPPAAASPAAPATPPAETATSPAPVPAAAPPESITTQPATAVPAAPDPTPVPAASVTPQWGAVTPPASVPAVPAAVLPASVTVRPATAPPVAGKSPGDSGSDPGGKPAIKSRIFVVKPSAARQAISGQTPYRESTSMLWGLWKKQVEVGAAPHGEQVVAPALGDFFKQVRREAGPSAASPQPSNASYQVPVRYVVLQ